MPSASKSITSSFGFLSSNAASFPSNDFRRCSICRMSKDLPSCFFATSISAAKRSISSRVKFSIYSRLMATFSNCVKPRITASQLCVAIFAQNSLRRLFSKSFFVATRIFAVGYSRMNSAPVCSVRCPGTTSIAFVDRPRRFDSMIEAIISNVLPAPTQCARSVLPP